MPQKWLHGVLVVDLSRLIPGGFCSWKLRQMGARVIKVEQPGVGDYYRALIPDKPLLGEQVFQINQGKESLALNLKSPQGRDILEKLLKKADVLMESFRPGVLATLGFSFRKLRQKYPQLIVCSISGSGQKGPPLAVHDLNILGLSGLLMKNRDDQGRPVIPDFQIVDLSTGQEAAMKVSAALYERTRTGKGGLVDISMFGTMEAWACLYPSMKTPSILSGKLPCYGVYATQDEKWITLAALEHKFWEKFCSLIERPDWAKHSPLISSVDVQKQKQELAEIFLQRPLLEWSRLGEKQDLCLFPVRELDGCSQKSGKVFGKLGADTGRLVGSLGYTKTEIRDLCAKGVLQ